MNGHDFGRSVEARFIAEASEHGLYVSHPWSELPGYDSIVDTGKRIFRVQVKGVRPDRAGRNAGAASCTLYRRRRFPSRRHDKYDILAIYHAGDSRWFFFHRRQVPRYLTRMYLSQSRTGHWVRRARSWDIFSE
jgi:hypothetical protein